MAEYDTRTDEALSRLVSTLPSAAAQILVSQLDEALTERELLCRNVRAGTEDAIREHPTPSWRHALGITASACKVQSIIAACVDAGIQEGLLLNARERWFLGGPTRGLSSSAPLRLTTLGCGGST